MCELGRSAHSPLKSRIKNGWFGLFSRNAGEFRLWERLKKEKTSPQRSMNKACRRLIFLTPMMQLLLALALYQLLSKEGALMTLIKMKEYLSPGGQIFIETFVRWDALYENNEHQENEQEVEVSANKNSPTISEPG